jgi:hypothetical protein
MRAFSSVVILVLLLLGARPALATGPLSFLAKAAKLGSKAGKASKIASGAKAAKLVGATGAALAAERAAMLFTRSGDDIGRGAAYVARESGGDFLVVVKNGPQDIKTAHPSQALAELPHENVDVYVDLSAAQHPTSLPEPSGTGRLYVLDAEAKPHPLRVAQKPDGVSEYVVDYGGDAIDLASFVADQISDESESDEPPLAFMLIAPTLVGACWIGWFWLKRRKRQREIDAQGL